MPKSAALAEQTNVIELASTKTNRPNGYTTQMQRFEDYLNMMVDQRTAALVKITPPMAEVMLERMRPNRPLSEKKVRAYVRDMERGNWSTTSQGLGFDTNGHLYDGQHRLHAVIRSGIPMETWIIFGNDPAGFAHVDRGKTRSNANLLAMQGHKYANALAAAAKFLILYELESISMAANRRGIDSGDGTEITGDDVLDYIRTHPDLVELLNTEGVVAKYYDFPCVPQSALLALEYICRKEHPRKAEEFFQKLCRGTDLSEGDPIFNVRRRLTPRSKNTKLDPIAHRAAMIVQAWNGRKSGFQVNPGAAFPRIR